MAEQELVEIDGLGMQRDFLGTRHLEDTFQETAGVYLKEAGIMNSLDGIFKHFQFRQDSVGIHIPYNYGDFQWSGSGYVSYTNNDRSASVSIILSSQSKEESVRMMEYIFYSPPATFGVRPVSPLQIGEHSMGRRYSSSDGYELVWLWKNCVVAVSWAQVSEGIFKDFCARIQKVLLESTVADIYSRIPSPLPLEPINARLDEPFPLDLRFYGNHNIQPWDLLLRVNASEDWHKLNSEQYKIRFTLQNERNVGWSGVVKNLASPGSDVAAFTGRLEGVVVNYLDRLSLLGTQIPLQISVI